MRNRKEKGASLALSPVPAGIVADRIFAGSKLMNGRISNAMQQARSFLADERGQDMVEYSLLLVLIGSVAIIYLTGIGINVSSILNKVSAKVESTDNAIP
jgi:Flp pilus assembly pilin Flp